MIAPAQAAHLGKNTLAEVRDATGHANIAITSIYTHIAIEDDGKVGHLFV